MEDELLNMTDGGAQPFSYFPLKKYRKLVMFINVYEIIKIRRFMLFKMNK